MCVNFLVGELTGYPPFCFEFQAFWTAEKACAMNLPTHSITLKVCNRVVGGLCFHF